LCGTDLREALALAGSEPRSKQHHLLPPQLMVHLRLRPCALGLQQLLLLTQLLLPLAVRVRPLLQRATAIVPVGA
jgi:hypothetical protein